jgi:pimeloyl-ACP methyl ester carboxylesterase
MAASSRARTASARIRTSSCLRFAAVSALLLLVTSCGRHSPTAPVSNATSTARTALGAPNGTADTQGAVHLEGEIGPGALYSLDKPADWNGDLVLYMHGYTTPGSPISLPNNGAIRDKLLGAGFAVAASSFSENGYAVPEAMRQTHQLRSLFVSRVAKPERVFLFGLSLGGIVGMELVEKFPQQYDGAFLASGVVGGTREEAKYISDTKVLFDQLYPNVHLGGLYDPIPITEPNTQLIAPVVGAVQANPQGLGILQLVTRHPLAGNNGQEITTSLVTVLGFQMFGATDLMDRMHGHSFFDNAGYTYANAALPQSILGPLNTGVARFRSTADARAWMDHYGEPSGELRIPVLTIHNTRDPVVPFFHEALLADAVSARGFSDNLVQRSKNSYGHSAFTPDELLQNFQDLVHWVDTGVKP